MWGSDYSSIKTTYFAASSQFPDSLASFIFCWSLCISGIMLDRLAEFLTALMAMGTINDLITMVVEAIATHHGKPGNGCVLIAQLRFFEGLNTCSLLREHCFKVIDRFHSPELIRPKFTHIVKKVEGILEKS